MHTLRAQTTKRTDSSKDGLKRVTTNRGKQETEDLTKLSDVKNRYKTEAENINTPCAFHDMERITNFCRNRDCLLPLCPKCVKLHTEEHAKLGNLTFIVGVFGEFVTIGECLTQTERGLKTIMLKTLEF